MNDSNQNDSMKEREARLHASRAQRRPTAARRVPQQGTQGNPAAVQTGTSPSARQERPVRTRTDGVGVADSAASTGASPSARQERPVRTRTDGVGVADSAASTGASPAARQERPVRTRTDGVGTAGTAETGFSSSETGGTDMRQSVRNSNRRGNGSGVRRRTGMSRSRKGPKATGKESTAVSSLVRAILYISFILVISGGLAYFGITAGNDMFAFVKDDNVVEITTEEGVTVGALSKQLHDAGVIRYPSVFRFYAKLRKKESGLIATTQTVSASMSYDKLLAAFKEQKKPREEIKVTIPEGYTVEDIIKLFTEEKGIGTREGFVAAINEYSYDYWFIPEQSKLRPGRLYRLEGYLYPDTYYFYTDWSEVSIINKMLSNFEAKFDMRYKARAEELGWSVDDVIILASMLQMEAKYETEYGKISSVFHNRLGNTAVTGGRLESDATIDYILPEHAERITSEELKIDSPYNTYLYAGLPPGPIGNPTSYAINYALYPDSTDYYYFVAQSNGYSLFARTYEEHLRNVAAVEAERRS